MDAKAIQRIITLFGMAAMLLSVATTSASGQSSNRDTQLVQSKINAAQRYYAETWSELFRARGTKFAPPPLIIFSDSVQTGCDELKAGNAFYCVDDNSVYLDSALLTTMMKEARKALGTNGDYAATVIAAHEYGHAIAAQSNVEIAVLGTFSREQQADCFAGVITRRAKTDGLLEAGYLAEGLFSLARASDGTGPGGLYQMMFLPIDHGIVEQRHTAFLGGYYGGPGFCGLGVPKPPTAGRVIATTSLLPPSSISPGRGNICTWSNEPGGLRVRNLSTTGDCMFTLLPDSTMLPDHVRIELTMTRLPNGIAGLGSTGGIYYGDARSAAVLTRFGLDTSVFKNPRTGAKETRIELVNIDSGTSTFDLFGTTFASYRFAGNILGENRLMLDVHHEGKDVYLVEYVNGLPAGFGHWQGVRSSRLGAEDQAGVWLRYPGSEAIFKDFRVTILPN